MLHPCRRDPFQNRCDRRAIRRAGPDMMQGDDAGRIDQDIPAALGDIPSRLLHLLSLQDLLQIRPPGSRSPDVPEGSGEHPVGPVRFAGSVDEKRPGQRSILDVASGKEAVLERDHHDADIPLCELLFPITQLRDVRAAGESAEVAVEHHHQPATPELLEVVAPACAVPKAEGDGGLPGQVTHGAAPRADVAPWSRIVASYEYPLWPPGILWTQCAGGPAVRRQVSAA